MLLLLLLVVVAAARDTAAATMVGTAQAVAVPAAAQAARALGGCLRLNLASDCSRRSIRQQHAGPALAAAPINRAPLKLHPSQ